MYESFYGLKWRPFAAAPDPAGYVAVGDLRQKHAALRQCIEAGQGIAILTAPAGMGKTLVLRKLLGELRDTFANVFLANSNFASRRALLQGILYELGQPYTDMDEQELRLALTSALRGVRSRRKAVLLAVDEAHLLDDALLDEIRCVTNLVEYGEPLVRVVLAGQLLLEERLASPALQALNQRVGCHVTLEPYTRRETADYMRQRLRWAGAEIGKVFATEAVETICAIADGIPRCINHLCDHSLLVAYIAQIKPVPKQTVLEAFEELRQLPLQWNEPSFAGEVEVAESAPQEVSAAPAGSPPPPLFAGAAASIEVGAGEPETRAPRIKSFDEGAAVVEFGSLDVGGGHAEIEGASSESAPAAQAADAESARTDQPFDWRKHSRPCLSPPEEVGPAGTVEEEFVAECEFESARANPEPEFEEEVVVDRYAALDAVRERSHLRVRMDLRPKPDGLLDAVTPLLDDAVHADDGSDDSVVAPVRTRLYYEDEENESAEEQIGAAVLDTCLETHKAIFGPMDADSDDEHDARGAAETETTELRAGQDDRGSGDAVEYDVVQPEDDGATPFDRGDGNQSGKPPEKPVFGRNHCYKLFTELRRRKR